MTSVMPAAGVDGSLNPDPRDCPAWPDGRNFEPYIPEEAQATMVYRSRQSWRGIPVIDISFRLRRGDADATGRAFGVIAIGNVAVGVVAIGFVAIGPAAVGLVAAGVVSLGLVALGVVAAGLVAAGVTAVGLIATGIKVAAVMRL